MIHTVPISVIWSAAPSKLELSADEVHVWRAALCPEPGVLRRLEATLTPDEISKAAQFSAPCDRHRLIAVRGILRELLAAYLNRLPAALELDCGHCGKPALPMDDSDLLIRLNLSLSRGLALYAFAHGREVGIDLELIQTVFCADEVAERFFSPRELAELRALPPESRSEGFFNCWTRKEAYVKACGGGLQIPLDSFDVSLTPGHPHELSSADSLRWSLRSFQPALGFVAAVVAEGRGWRLRHLEWTP